MNHTLKTDEALRLLAADPARTGVFTDFDGTLSAIVDRPEDALPVDGATEVLAALARRFAIVAVVSGRSLDELGARVRAPGVVLAGSYGRERSDRVAQRRSTQGWETVAAAAAAMTRDLSGVVLERKGAGIALHFRQAPERADAVTQIAQALAEEYQLELAPGRKVVELVHPGPGKGEAVATLATERDLETVLVAGDDVGDIDAFRWAHAASVRSVVVAVTSEEAPAGLEAHADLVMPGPADFVEFLARVAEAAG